MCKPANNLSNYYRYDIIPQIYNNSGKIGKNTNKHKTMASEYRNLTLSDRPGSPYPFHHFRYASLLKIVLILAILVFQCDCIVFLLVSKIYVWLQTDN